MARLPCVFCTMASRANVRTVRQLQTLLDVRCVRRDERIGHTLWLTGTPLPI